MFVWKAEAPLRTPEQVAREVHEVSLARGLDEFATVLALMAIAQESGFWCPWNRADASSEHYPHDSESNDGRSVGYLQEQNGAPGEDLGDSRDNWWGPMASRMDLKRSVDQFLDRLADDYHRADNDPGLASEVISNVQQPRANLRGEYAKHWDTAWRLVHGLGPVAPAPAPPVIAPARPDIQPNPGWRGDPVFLPDLLRAWGLAVTEYPGWRDRGHGDFGEIRGVVMHHTGSFGESPRGIAEHPTLGLASQIYLSPTGAVVICGAGIAWHAGDGGGIPWLPDGDANEYTIGIEAANDGGGSPPGRRDAWSPQQYDAYTTVCAAICWYLGLNAERVIMHKTWAGAAQGKWDPGGLELDEVRPDVQAKIEAGPPGAGGLTIGDITVSGNDAAIVVAAARKMLGMWDNDDLNQRHAWHSRARCRRDDAPVDDTVGMGLFVDANIYDLLTAWSAVEVSDPFSVETIELGVAGKLPANDAASLAWFRSVDAKITKTARARAHAALDELKAALAPEPAGG